MRMNVFWVAAVLAASCLLSTAPCQEPPPTRQEDLLAAAERVMERVAELRGMPFRRPVGKEVYTQEQLAELLRVEFERLLPEERIRPLEIACRSVGLLPQGVAIRETMAELLLGQAAGLYLPEKGSLKLMAGRGGPELAMVVIAHELAHALDDQYFDLKALLDSARIDSDRGFAVVSAVEGSAMAQQMRFVSDAERRGELSLEALMAEAEKERETMEAFFARAPLFSAMVLPRYTMGLLFVARGRMNRVASVAAVDLERVLTDPPRSSEQILHPEKYWDPEKRDDPIEVLMPPASRMLGQGWHLIGSDTLGEILCALLARPADFRFRAANQMLLMSPSFWTNEAARGWGGDRIHVYENARGENAVIWCSAWDSEEDAEIFMGAFQRHRPGQAAAELRQGPVVVLVFGLESGLAKIVARRCLEGTRFRKVQEWKPAGVKSVTAERPERTVRAKDRLGHSTPEPALRRVLAPRPRPQANVRG